MHSQQNLKKCYQDGLLDVGAPSSPSRNDYGDSLDILSHDELVSLRGVMEERNHDVGQRILALSEHVAEVEAYTTDLLTQRRNLKNDILTVQDENLHLQLALNRERRKVRRAWSQLEHGLQPKHLSRNRQQSILSFVLPWNINSTNENDVIDFADLEGCGEASIRARAGALLTWSPLSGRSHSSQKKQGCRAPSCGHHHRYHYHHHRRYGETANDVPSAPSSRSRMRPPGRHCSEGDHATLSYEPVALD